MHTNPTPPDVGDLVTEVSGLMVGLGVVSVALFPLAVPLIALVVAPLVLLALAGAVLAAPFVLPVLLVRRFRRDRSRRKAERGAGVAGLASRLRPAR
jgi:hypothetical protein